MDSTTNSKKILRFDASALVQSGCKLRLKRILLDGITEKAPYNDTLYGSAFHKFVSRMYETSGNFSIAMAEASTLFEQPKLIRDKKQHLTQEHLAKTCIDYWQHFASKDTAEVITLNGKPLVEISFDTPFITYGDYQCNLTGTIDKFCKIQNGPYCIGDYKTHSLYSVGKNGGSYKDKLIADFFRVFEQSLQIRFYVYNLKLTAQASPENEFSKLILSNPIGAFIDGVFISSSVDSEFYRSNIKIYTDEELTELGELLREEIYSFVQLIDTFPNYSKMDGIIHGCCSDGKYLCKFFSVCSQPKEDIKQLIIQQHFRQKEYNPLKFHEV